MESEYGRHCADVAWWLHYSERVPGDIKKAFDKNPKLENLLMDDFFSGALNKYQAVVAEGDHSCDRDWSADAGVLYGAGVL